MWEWLFRQDWGFRVQGCWSKSRGAQYIMINSQFFFSNALTPFRGKRDPHDLGNPIDTLNFRNYYTRSPKPEQSASVVGLLGMANPGGSARE